MEKIPVGATIAHGYRFGFGKFFPILGTMWLPWAIMAAGGYALMSQRMAWATALMKHDYASLPAALMLLVPFYVVSFFLLVMQIAGINELALGLRKPSLYYFSLAKPVWRLTGAFLLAFLIAIAGYAVMLLLPFSLVLLLRSAHLPLIAGLLVAAVFVAALCAYLYGMCRLMFLLAPVVVAEQRTGLQRSWALGRGNFWRIFAVTLCIFLPFAGAEILFVFSYLMHGLPPLQPPYATPDQIAATREAAAAWQAAMMERITGRWYVTYPLFVAFTALFYGTGAGAQCFAYRALTQEPAAGPG